METRRAWPSRREASNCSIDERASGTARSGLCERAAVTRASVVPGRGSTSDASYGSRRAAGEDDGLVHVGPPHSPSDFWTRSTSKWWRPTSSSFASRAPALNTSITSRNLCFLTASGTSSLHCGGRGSSLAREHEGLFVPHLLHQRKCLPMVLLALAAKTRNEVGRDTTLGSRSRTCRGRGGALCEVNRAVHRCSLCSSRRSAHAPRDQVCLAK